MTAAEWLTAHFGPTDEFSPMPSYTATRQSFLDWFGAVLETALAGGTSTYDALMATPDGTRGWDLYFNDWKARGILA